MVLLLTPSFPVYFSPSDFSFYKLMVSTSTHSSGLHYLFFFHSNLLSLVQPNRLKHSIPHPHLNLCSSKTSHFSLTYHDPDPSNRWTPITRSQLFWSQSSSPERVSDWFQFLPELPISETCSALNNPDDVAIGSFPRGGRLIMVYVWRILLGQSCWASF